MRALSDANGNTVATYDYDVFGAIRNQMGSGTKDSRIPFRPAIVTPRSILLPACSLNGMRRVCSHLWA